MKPWTQTIATTKFLKELLPIGTHFHPTKKEKLEFSRELAEEVVTNTKMYLSNGNKIPLPPTHNSIDESFGWVQDISIREDSVFITLSVGDANIVKTRDVSAFIERNVIDSKGNKYPVVLTHVALTPFPALAGLGEFFLAASKYQIGGCQMAYYDDLVKELELDNVSSDEQFVELALSKVKELKEKQPVDLSPIVKALELSKDSPSVDDITDALLSKLNEHNKDDEVNLTPREIKLTKELQNTKIKELIGEKLTPAAAKELQQVFNEDSVIALSSKETGPDLFDKVLNVIRQNEPLELGERTKLQTTDDALIKLSRNIGSDKSPRLADMAEKRAKAFYEKNGRN